MTNNILTTKNLATTETDTQIETTDNIICKNCETTLNGPFCYQCGQPSKSVIRFFGDLFRELFEDILSLDSRTLKTITALLFRPGFLTNEYVSGKRFRYVPPLRLFIITSLICIFVLWLLTKFSDMKLNIADQEKMQEVKEQLAEQENIVIFDKTEIEKKLASMSAEERAKAIEKIKQAQSLLDQFGLEQELTINETPNPEPPDDTQLQGVKKAPEPPYNKGINIDDNFKVTTNLPFLSKEQDEALEMKLQEKLDKAKKDPSDFFADLLQMVPKTMLFFVPVFALLMKLSYPFSRRYYIEHIIFTFHTHAFLFLSILILVGLNHVNSALMNSENIAAQIGGWITGLAKILLSWWLVLYIYLAMKKVYKQGWFLTLFKFIFLGLLYIILFSFAASGVLIISVLI